jgi:hypothetical protein
MKKIIRLTESDLARIVRRVIREEEEKKEEDCSDLCMFFYPKQNKCLSLDEFETDIEKLISGWYKEKYKNPVHRWFFSLKETDPDVKELYIMSKYNDESQKWTEMDEMIFFYELASAYCDDEMEEYIETSLEHPCHVEKPKKILA